MDRRLFLLSSLAGLADPVSPIPTSQPSGPVTQSGDAAFDAWSQDFVSRAAAAGWPEAVLRRELKDLTPDPRVIQSDRGQPEFVRPMGDYMRAAVSPTRIALGLQKEGALAPWPATIEQRFGVDRNILTGVWGLESDFGAVQGDMDVVRCLATLAADGRRQGWAEGELFAALRIIATNQAPREKLKGSWAGAMGQTQLEPSVFLRRGVDIDGDGRIDIWGSSPDALGAAAGILQAAGWALGQSWAREVTAPPGFDYGLTEGPKNPPAWWSALGVKRADGQAWSAADVDALCQMIAPAGAKGPAFLLFPNHFAIRVYNNATSYALAVGLIADGVAGAPALTVPWPEEQPLSRDQRLGAQTALKALGFDVGEPDGVIGVKTRAALRAWQAARGLVADGHLTVELSQQLVHEASSR